MSEPAAKAVKSELVAVTGASGYVAGWVIRELQSRGFKVRGTVRSLQNADKVKHLQEDFPDLELFEADLLQPGSFDKCFEGCQGVFHTASPFQTSVNDAQTDLVDPAVNGTRNVLEAARKAGVKKVIVTSSCAAVANETTPPPEKVWTEEDWNTESTLTLNPYRFSKTQAEHLAWDFVKEHKCFKLAVMNPSFVVGPPCSTRTDSTSIKVIKGLMDGSAKKDGARPSCFGCVDVRDLAKAHVEAYVRDVESRYVLSSSEGISQLELAQFLASDPELAKCAIPTHEQSPISHRPKYSAAKAEAELGVKMSPIKNAIVDMGRFLLKSGIVSTQ